MSTITLTYPKRILSILIPIVVVIGAAAIFAFRYQPAFTFPNFYAEDGSVFVSSVLEHGFLQAMFTSFNGYLVVGQYMIVGLAFLMLQAMGGSFSELPFYISIASCTFLGLTAALPFLLFKHEMGWKIALLTVVLLAFVPMPGSDFAVIGTIGNLKFAFMVWAVLFTIYRVRHHDNIRKVLLCDAVLLICVLTNISTVGILPAILWPYRKRIHQIVKDHFKGVSELSRDSSMRSGFVLLIVAGAYAITVYLLGIPTIPNYLDTPFQWEALDNIIYRVTAYSFLFFFSATMTDKLAIVAVISLLVITFLINKKQRMSLAFILFAVFIATFSFVVTRTGVGDHMLNYLKTPDQFFYAQSMLITFAAMWALVPNIKTPAAEWATILLAGLFILLSAPYGYSSGRNSELYRSRGDVHQNVHKACQGSQITKSVEIDIYPSEPWSLKAERSLVCE